MFLRRILHIPHTMENQKDTWISITAGKGVSQTGPLYKKKTKFLRPINRRAGLEKLIMTGKVNGKRWRGQRKQKYPDGLTAGKTAIDMIRDRSREMEWHYTIWSDPVLRTRPTIKSYEDTKRCLQHNTYVCMCMRDSKNKQSSSNERQQKQPAMRMEKDKC